MSAILETTIEAPIGALRLSAEGDALVAVHLPGRGVAEAGSRREPAHPVLAQARAQLAEYFAGHRARFELPLRTRGTPFQERVWGALAGIPYGETRSYAAIAAQVGRPEAVRAVGAAIGRNPLPIVLPCHRVIGADGSLTGYAGGTPMKAWLLRHERGVLAARGEHRLSGS
jgi:methylated-DNA-[protein]-cysteine S-methyltransferase